MRQTRKPNTEACILSHSHQLTAPYGRLTSLTLNRAPLILTNMNGYYPPQAQPYAYPGYSHSQYPGPRPTSSPLSMSSGMSPFYLIIIIGMVFFLFVNMMPASLPEAQRVM